MMRDDPRHLPDTTLSATEVKHVLERAVEIDAIHQTLSVSDLASAAREAGISEEAVLQAVQELLEDRQLTPAADRSSSASSAHVSRTRPWLIGVTSGLSLLIGLMVVLFILRMFP
jgi:hypothetical protein